MQRDIKMDLDGLRPRDPGKYYTLVTMDNLEKEETATKQDEYYTQYSKSTAEVLWEKSRCLLLFIHKANSFLIDYMCLTKEVNSITRYLKMKTDELDYYSSPMFVKYEGINEKQIEEIKEMIEEFRDKLIELQYNRNQLRTTTVKLVNKLTLIRNEFECMITELNNRNEFSGLNESLESLDKLYIQSGNKDLPTSAGTICTLHL